VNALDIGLLVLLAVGFGLGLARGLVRIVIGLLTLVVAFYLASRYQDAITSVLTARHVAPTPARMGAYVVVFLATMIVGGLVAWIVGKMLKLAMLSWADRLAGGALGIVAALVAAAFVVHPLVASSHGGSTQLETSKLAPYVSVVADLGNAVAPDAVAKRYESGIDSLRTIWRGESPLPVDQVKKALTHVVEKGERAVEDVKKKVVDDGKKAH
jgi:membrane protein required for colicin V production